MTTKELSKVGNAVFLAEDALGTLFENVAPQFSMFEGMTIDQLVNSSNDYRDPNKNYRAMKPQVDPVWRVDPAKKEVTATFYFKSSKAERNKSNDDIIDTSDTKDVHKPEILFTNMEIKEVDPKEERKTARSAYAKLVPMFIPKDASFDIERWLDDTADTFETPEEQREAMALLFDRYYVTPVTSKTEVAVRCTCLDYHYSFFKANKKKGTHFGKPTVGRSVSLKYTGEPRNPDKMIGYCAHLQFALEMMSTQPLFWQSKAKITGSKKHKVDSDDIGVWSDASGF
jgi:hypothetical protein